MVERFTVMRAFERGCDNGLVSPQHVSLPGNERVKMAYIYWRFWCAQDPDFERLMCSIEWPKDAPSTQTTYDEFGVYRSLRERGGGNCSGDKFVRGTETGPSQREVARRAIPTRVLVAERERHQFLNRLLLPISDKFGEPPQSAPFTPSVESRVAAYRATRKKIHRARAAELGIAL